MRTKNYYPNTLMFFLLFLCISLFQKTRMQAQIGINATGTPPAPNAMLDVSSTNKGVLLPRITNASAISSPTAGMLFYNTTSNKYNFHNGSSWLELGSLGLGSQPWTTQGNDISNSNTGNVGIGISTPSYKLHLGNSYYGFRIEGPQNSGVGGEALSISSNGDVNVDAPFFAGGRFSIKENGNVGIGNAFPDEKLDVIGKIKTSSLQITNGAANGKILISDVDGNANWTVPVSQPNYWTINGNNIYNNNIGNIGINEPNPAFPLNFNGNYGDKISFWGNAATETHFGIGIQPNLFQIYSKLNVDDIAFGYGSSANFTEQMRIKGNGSVRIHGTAALSNEPSLSIGGNGNISVDAPGVVGGRFIIKDNGNVGVGNNNPLSKLEVNGTFATKVVYWGGPIGGIVFIDDRASVYIITDPNFSVQLPNPTTCPNRRYVIVNKSSGVCTFSGYYNLNNILTSSNTFINGIPSYFFPAGSSIEIISDGISRWDQIK